MNHLMLVILIQRQRANNFLFLPKHCHLVRCAKHQVHLILLSPSLNILKALWGHYQPMMINTQNYCHFYVKHCVRVVYLQFILPSSLCITTHTYTNIYMHTHVHKNIHTCTHIYHQQQHQAMLMAWGPLTLSLSLSPHSYL